MRSLRIHHVWSHSNSHNNPLWYLEWPTVISLQSQTQHFAPFASTGCTCLVSKHTHTHTGDTPTILKPDLKTDVSKYSDSG